MKTPEKDEISDEESFELSLHRFLGALELLALDATAQCRSMGNYNVAWELKDDASEGYYLIRFPCRKLNEEQKYSIKQFLNELRKIPDSVLISATTEVDNLDAMNHPCWNKIRKHASIIMRILEGAKIKNEKYFK